MGDEKKLESLDGLDLANRIYEIGMLVNQSGTLDDVIKAIVERMLEETGSDYVGVALVSKAGDRVVHAWGLTSDGEWISKKHSVGIGEGVTGHVVRTGKPIYVEDVSIFESYYPLVEGIKSEMAVPLKVGEQIIGTLDIESREKGKFGKREMAMLQLLTTPVALAIHNSRLFQKERRRLEQLAVLNKVSHIITSTVELEELINRTVDVIRKELDYPFVGLALKNEDTGRIQLRAMSSELLVGIEVGHSQEPGEGVVGEVFASGKSLLVPDVTKWPNYVETGSTVRSEMCVPIQVKGQVIGILDAASDRTDDFAESDLMVFKTVADHIAQAVANARYLEHTAKMREDLSRMVVHDLKNPLTVIETTLEYMEHFVVGNDEDSDRQSSNRRYIENARASCDRLNVMISGLLELQRIEAGELELEKEEASAAEIVEHVVDAMFLVASAMQVDMSSGVMEKGLKAECDRTLVTRVLENLVANALKYTPEGGSVTVNASRASADVLSEKLAGSSSGVLFTVRDTGPGIRPADQDRIFEKFAMAESGDADRNRGAGLGLAFCKQAIKAHEGSIWVESEPGKGSTFCFVIPTPEG
jgi:signal transduction histidine kinase